MRYIKRKVRLSPYKRDVYLAYLINGARRTLTDGFPITENWMVETVPPKNIVQWDQRSQAEDPAESGISFYCEDSTFQTVIGDPKKYISEISRFACVIGMDASPYDNMPLVVQKSQIYVNLAVTYYFGRLGRKVIPNVRIGDPRTLSSLEAYPHHTLISIGTNGFTWARDNRNTFLLEVKKVVEVLEPSGILVYGKTPDWLFGFVKERRIPVYQYDSYMSKRRKLR